jgi:hypothetical protein
MNEPRNIYPPEFGWFRTCCSAPQVIRTNGVKNCRRAELRFAAHDEAKRVSVSYQLYKFDFRVTWMSS